MLCKLISIWISIGIRLVEIQSSYFVDCLLDSYKPMFVEIMECLLTNSWTPTSQCL
jgi:hypothetical protein